MSDMNGLLRIDHETASFGAGTLLKDVYAVLLEHGAMLPCSPGVIGEQTLAGALATGTHGQGLGQSALSDAIASLEVVMTDGQLTKVASSDPTFGALLLSLGVLGIVVSVELRHVPNRTFVCRKSVLDFSTFCDSYEQCNDDHTFVKAWWFPETQQVHQWCVNPIDRQAGDSSEMPLQVAAFSQSQQPNFVLNDVVAGSRERMSQDTGMPLGEHPCYRTVERFANFHDITGNVYDILCKGIPAPQVNIEIGIPFSECVDVLRALDSAMREQHISLHYPVILRVVGASSAWLSPAHVSAICYFGMVVYTDAEGKTDPTALEAAQTLERILAQRGGRPHWGKFFDPNLYQMRALYPRIPDFCTLRSALDPQRRLCNPFIDALLAHPPQDRCTSAPRR
jgi:FAD/FMN-containing dehydrogenase